MTNIEKRTCAFLLALLMGISAVMVSPTETVCAEEETESAALEAALETPETALEVLETPETALEALETPETVLETLETPAALETSEVDPNLSMEPENQEVPPEPLNAGGEQAYEQNPAEPRQEIELQEDLALPAKEGAVQKDQSGNWECQVADESKKLAVITGYAGADGKGAVTIPGTISISSKTGVKTYTVTTVGEYAFKDAEFTSVKIPKTVTLLQYGAFLICQSLKSVSFEAGSALKKISDRAFSLNASLESFMCPNSLKSIGEYAFSGTGLKSIKIPDKVKFLSEGVFTGCSELSSVALGNGVGKIGDNAFSYCGKLTEISLPNELLSIGSYAFLATGLKGVSVPKSVTQIDNYGV